MTYFMIFEIAFIFVFAVAVCVWVIIEIRTQRLLSDEFECFWDEELKSLRANDDWTTDYGYAGQPIKRRDS